MALYKTEIKHKSLELKSKTFYWKTYSKEEDK